MRRRVRGILMSGNYFSLNSHYSHSHCWGDSGHSRGFHYAYTAFHFEQNSANKCLPILSWWRRPVVFDLSTKQSFTAAFIFFLGKQFSLDSRMDLVFHGIGTGVRTPTESAKLDDKNRAITEDSEESWEGTKGR